MDASYQDDCILKGIPSDQCSLYKKLIQDFREASSFWLIMTAIAFMASNIARALRWQMLYRPLGYQPDIVNSFGGVMIAYFVNLGLPRAGEFARAGVMTNYEKIPFEVSFGTIITDRILDLFCLLILLTLGFLFHSRTIIDYLTTNASINSTTLYISVFILIVVGLSAVFMVRRIVSTPTEQLTPWKAKIQHFINGFWAGLTSVLRIPNWPLLIFYSLAIWFLYLLMHVLAFYAYEPTSHLGMLEGLLVFDFAVLGIIFPSPGGMGSYHAMVGEGLQIVGVDPVSAFSWAMITFFTLNVGCNIVFGILSMLFLPFWNTRKEIRKKTTKD